MRLALAVLLASLPLRALADCTPADPQAIAEAERKARDAEARAAQAESVAVRSGNPGAHARALEARGAAAEAQAELARLGCREADAAEPAPEAPPRRSRYGR